MDCPFGCENELECKGDCIPYTECLICGSIWSPGTEEYDCQRCRSCGWFAGEPTDEDLEDDDDEDYEDYDPDWDVTNIY